MTFDDATPLGEAREWLREQAAGRGARCPCCQQNVKIYRRRIRKVQAEMLIRAWKQAGQREFRRASLFPGEAEADFAKLRYWGLLEDLHELREDGGPAGHYRVTDLGVRWIYGFDPVTRDALIYDGRLLGLDQESGPWTVHDALGEGFNYRELMDS